jgi:hypothetical protein
MTISCWLQLHTICGEWQSGLCQSRTKWRQQPLEMHPGAMPRSGGVGKNAERIDCMLKHDRARARKQGFQRNRSIAVDQSG